MSYKQLENILTQRKTKHAFRSLTLNEKLIDFCSNDYLGFAKKKLI